MSVKKITLAMVGVLIAVALMVIPNEVKAYTDLTGNETYFGVKEFRDGNTSADRWAYSIGDVDSNTSTVTNSAVIWKLLQYANNTVTDAEDTQNIYCVRALLGFTDTGERAKYDIAYDLKTEQSTLASSSRTYLQNLANNAYYNNLLALADLLYLKDVSTSAEKKALMDAAGIYTTEFYSADQAEYTYYLTDDDIEAVQQAAIWYYTNADNATIFDRYGEENTSWLLYNTEERDAAGDGYTSLSDYNKIYNGVFNVGEGKQRQEQAVLLYNYLITTANANASTYSASNSKTKITLYANSTIDNTQPVIIIEREKENNFDLSLRKYITKVDSTTLTGTSNTRVPTPNTTKLDSGDATSACYLHRKDPVAVSTGSVVTYNLTIYNEGDKAGRATKITDQLPTGLVSNLKTGDKVTSSKGNEYTVTYDETNNTLTFVTTGTNNLAAYETTLDSDTIELTATVTATVGTSDKILTNLAWISEEYDAVDNVTITNQSGADRDSEPATITTKTADELVTTDNGYIGNSSNKTDLTDSSYCYKGQQDDDDFEKLILKSASYDLVLVKEDSNGEDLNSTATFEVNGVEKTVTGRLTIADDVAITDTTTDIYTIKETVPPDKYCAFDGTIKIEVIKKQDGDSYAIDKIKYYVDDEEVTTNRKDLNVYLSTDGNIYVEVKDYQFDLKLVKRIVEVNGQSVTERIEDVDISKLAAGTATTADYSLNKEPVSVMNGDIVKYTLRVYNEGEIDGYASEITEDIPDGLELLWSEKTGDELTADTTLTDAEKEAIAYNQLIWKFATVNSNTNKVEMVTTDYLALGKGAEIAEDGANLIKAFDSSKSYTNTVNDKNPDYKEVSIYLKVTADNNTRDVLRNEAAITEDTDSKGNEVTDRDSDTEDWVKYEDDEDYDRVILQTFDLALRKFIIAVSSDEEISDSEYLKNSSGTYTRAPIVDTSKLNTTDDNGNMITTAIYNHTKEPLQVNINNYVIYMLRAYNEGDINGYAAEIKDHLPEYLEFVDNDFNEEYGWEVSSDGRTVTTTYLSNQLISKTSTDDDGTIVLSYKEVPIMCKVKDTAVTSQNITNIADITVYKDENKNSVTDRDSEESNVVLPTDANLPSYKDDETGDYIPGQEDDDDFEKVVVRKFDLALRKWVTHAIVVEDGKETVTSTGHKAEDDPEQVVKVELNRKKINSVTVKFKYSIRITNEGDVAGYAKEITDYVPEGLKFVAEDNSDWTDEGNNVISTRTLENTLLQPGETAEVTVTLTWINGNNNLGLKTNIAEISEDYNEYGIPDIDSTPDNQVTGEDDIDDAPVLLSIKTGQAKLYVAFGTIILITLAGGIILIKKFVL